MNDITNTTGGMPVSMSSREIAELTRKEHKNVKRDVEKMLKELQEDALKFERIYLDAMNREQTEYHLDRELTETLLLGYSAPLRRKVLARLRELEGIVARGPDLSDPAVLVRLLTEHATKRIEAEKRAEDAERKVEEVKPKADFYDAYLNADGLYGLQNAARALQCRPNLFIRWLKENYLFYQGGNLVARVQYIQSGHFEVKTTIVEDKVRPQAFITPKGLKYLGDRVPDNIKVGRAA